MANKHEGGILAHRFRYWILFLGLACISSIYSNATILNFTFVCMGDPVTSNSSAVIQLNGTDSSGKLNYDQNEKSALLMAVAIGTLVGIWPFNYFYIRFGARYSFLAAGVLSIITTFASPISAYAGFSWFMVDRVLQGFAYGADFAIIGMITFSWATMKQNGLFIAVLTSFNGVSTLITNPVSAAFCSSFLGWPSSYYSHAIFGIFAFGLWTLFYRDDPENSQQVSPIELQKIQLEKPSSHATNRKQIPYLKISTNLVIIVIWINAFVDIVTALFAFTYAPTYIKFVLNYSVTDTGLLVAIQGFIFTPIRLIAGLLSDGIKSLTELQKMLVFNTVSLVGAAIAFGLLAYIPASFPIPAVICITLGSVLAALNVGGFYKCAIFVARQHCHFVISIVQSIKCVSLFVSPLLVAIFVKDDTVQEQWRPIYLIFAISLVIANTLFYFCATVEAADFTEIPETKTEMSDSEGESSKLRSLETQS